MLGQQAPWLPQHGRTYNQTGLVPRLLTVILTTGLALLGLLLVAAELILNSVAKARVEAKRLAYLRLPAMRIFEEVGIPPAIPTRARRRAVPPDRWRKTHLSPVGYPPSPRTRH